MVSNKEPPTKGEEMAHHMEPVGPDEAAGSQMLCIWYFYIMLILYKQFVQLHPLGGVKGLPATPPPAELLASAAQTVGLVVCHGLRPRR
jgi:hypothetical protein